MKNIDFWKLIGEFEDGSELTVTGYSEVECIERLAELQEKHGRLTFYTGVSDEYFCDGEYSD